MLDLCRDVRLLALGLGQHLAQVREAFEHWQDAVVQPTGIQRAGEIVVLERGDLLDHHMVQPRQFLHLAPQEKRLEFAVVGDEIVHVLVAEAGALGHPKEENRGQRLVQVQPQNFTEGREPRQRHIPERAGHAAQFARVVEPAQNAVVQNPRHRLAALAAQELLVVQARGVTQGCAPHHHQLLAGRHVAKQLHDLLLMVDARDGAHKQLAAHPNRERVVRQLRLQGLGRAIERVAQCLHHALDIAAAVDHLVNRAVLHRRGEHAEGQIRRFEVLALEHAKSHMSRRLQEHDLCMVLITALAIVNQRLLEIQLAPGRTAHEQAGETPRLIQRLHKKRFRRRQPVEHHIGQRIAMIDRRVHL